MPTIGFTVFKDKILSGVKRQTIRLLRKRPIKVGEKLYLFWHLRRKDCVKLGEAVCTETFFINVLYDENFLDSGEPVFRIDVHQEPHSFGFQTLTESQADDLAKRDGFNNALEMLRWFSEKHGDLDGLIFQVIRWNNGSSCPVCGSPVHATADPKRDVCINAQAHNGQPYFLFRNHAREEFPEPPLVPFLEKRLLKECNCEG